MLKRNALKHPSYESKPAFRSTYVVVTLESDITLVNSWDFFLPEHEIPIIQQWFAESLELKKISHSTAGSRTSLAC